VALALLVVAIPTAAQEVPVAVDGLFEDWDGIDASWEDPSGDGSGIDFGSVRVRSDRERVTLLFDVGSEMNLQGGNSITLIVDGDSNASTGRAVEGTGAELVWTFGGRKGEVWTDGQATGVEQADIGLWQAPTVSSSQFEISFLRRTKTGVDIAPGPSVSFVLMDKGGEGGDRLPDEGMVTVEFSDQPPPPQHAVSLERLHPDHIRVVTWNVLFDGLFKRPAPFVRVLRALDPDVICFQEIWAHTARQAADYVALAIPGVEWHGMNTHEGHVVSRYPLLEAAAIDASGNYWALVDLPDDTFEVDLSVICAHPPCCDKEVERQEELDGIAAWTRDTMTQGDSPIRGGAPATFNLRKGTPIVITGDMNLVGGASQVQTLLSGRIADEGRFGTSFAPDWDGTPLADAWPRTAGGVTVATWRDERSSFSPGKLDYVIYSDSVLRMERAFILATEELAPEVLARYGLRLDDTLVASDHLPVVADFTPVAAPVRTEAGE
jgi:endonuclease/exonuclease/phosphatase family metal-dependent hydrolase